MNAKESGAAAAAPPNATTPASAVATTQRLAPATRNRTRPPSASPGPQAQNPRNITGPPRRPGPPLAVSAAELLTRRYSDIPTTNYCVLLGEEIVEAASEYAIRNGHAPSFAPRPLEALDAFDCVTR